MKMILPPQVEAVIEKLNACGQEAYVVGGCVRDGILGTVPHDWDIATSALPDEVKLSLNGCKLIDTGVKHGTITVIVDKLPIEVTTYRLDGEYSDNRHPDHVLFTSSLKEDLARRDFTINALAYNHNDGIIDCFSGIEDIQCKTIRCVGEPDLRFQEDGLRILRALRFASVLGFTIEASTSKSILKNSELLENIAQERINTEFTKLLCGENAEAVLRDYRTVIGQFLPEINAMFDFPQHNQYHIYDVWEHTLKSLSSVEATPVLRMTMLLHDIGKPLCYTMDGQGVGHFYGHGEKSKEMARIILQRLRLDKDTADTIVTLVKYHDLSITAEEKAIKRHLNRLGEKNFRLLLKVKKADVMAQNPDFQSRLNGINEIEEVLDTIIVNNLCFSLKNMDINGDDLLSLGVPKGAEIGKLLSQLLDEVMDNKCPNQHCVLMNRARLIKDEKA
jgi:tRNA nucleotidyltransferase (CCA-adding enzyme)